ncbi:MAG: 4Fe-4S dicluster domain-containing protein [Ignavibacteria bacterium]|nr:4Fe-4S dicluster domain-containing protein [Ignavibacteria bacterium]
MNYYITTDEKLRELVRTLAEQKWNIISADKQGTRFMYINDGKDLTVDAKARPTKVSAKQFVFPKSEPLFFFKKEHDDLKLIDPQAVQQKTVLFGAKPCDAAGLPIMEKLFNWDYKDEFFNKRVENTVVIGMACDYTDEYCFCTSVGLAPDSEKGSDVFLVPGADNHYVVKEVTPKGAAFIAEFKAIFSEAAQGDIKAVSRTQPAPEKKFNVDEVKNWLDGHFESEYWSKAGETCLGCAQCAFVCPVCHCFDIVDENCAADCGRRVKNWDACQFGLFTKHASGHNPRETQPDRYRQRVSHKFKYYQDKFGETLCTGCGRCSRNCAVGIDIAEIVANIPM